LYGNCEGFEKKIFKNEICTQTTVVFDSNEAYADVVEEKLLLSAQEVS
jgi:hypothetical protein